MGKAQQTSAQRILCAKLRRIILCVSACAHGRTRTGSALSQGTPARSPHPACHHIARRKGSPHVDSGHQVASSSFSFWPMCFSQYALAFVWPVRFGRCTSAYTSRPLRSLPLPNAYLLSRYRSIPHSVLRAKAQKPNHHRLAKSTHDPAAHCFALHHRSTDHDYPSGDRRGAPPFQVMRARPVAAGL